MVNHIVVASGNKDPDNIYFPGCLQLRRSIFVGHYSVHNLFVMSIRGGGYWTFCRRWIYFVAKIRERFDDNLHNLRSRVSFENALLFKSIAAMPVLGMQIRMGNSAINIDKDFQM